MFRFVVVDMPQIGAATIALALAALLYLIYRDMRMVVQMVVDLKEEVMISRMAARVHDDFEDESQASNSHASSEAGQCKDNGSGDRDGEATTDRTNIGSGGIGIGRPRVVRPIPVASQIDDQHDRADQRAGGVDVEVDSPSREGSASSAREDGSRADGVSAE
jgi:hypothetical protein